MVDRTSAPKIPLDPYAMRYDAVTSAQAAAGTGADWMGPLAPMAPTAPPQVAGRQLDYPVGYNLRTTPRAAGGVSFDDLRALADSYDILRMVIETRKDQMSRMKWSIQPKLGPDGKPKCKPSDTRIVELTNFFMKPSAEYGWSDWLRMLLEDMFVVDAATLYRQRTRGGKLLSLEPIDGATIARKVNAWGRTPLPPTTAYQQILKGMPAVDYTTKDLIYKRRNVRTNRFYGFSPVEQIIVTINIALRRQVFNLQYYTEGNIPEALIGVPENWNPDQIETFQKIWDAYFEGNTASRRHAKFVPGGVAKTFIPTKEPELKTPFDEFLARVVCFAFSISPQPFVTQMNRATAETDKERAEQEGLAPIMLWLKELIDSVIAEDFKCADVAEFQWNEDEEIDPKTQSEINLNRAKAGTRTLNEMREDDGLDPSPDLGADKLMVLTPTGYVPVDANIGSDGNTIHADEKMQAQHELDMASAAAKQPKDDEEGDDPKPPKKPAKKPANKLFKYSGRVRSRHVVHHTRPHATASRVKIQKRVADVLAATAKDVAKQIRKAEKLFKADETPEERARRIVQAIQLGTMDDLKEALNELQDVAGSAGEEVLATLGVSDRAGLVDQVYDRAVEYAQERSSSLVTSVSDSTRDDLRDVIAQGLKDNVGLDAIADRIADVTSDDGDRIFGDERAELIARTEVGNANGAGALEGAKVARDQAGLNVMKEWLADNEACDECMGNVDDGVIPLDQEFSSGDDAPLAHPHCECALGEVVVEDTEDEQ